MAALTPLDPLASSAELRGVATGDVDGDGLEDIVTVGAPRPVIFLNSDAGADAKNRFAQGQVLFAPTATPVISSDFVDDPNSPTGCSSGGGLLAFGVAEVGGFHLALVDLDSDSDLDLVVANAYASNCAYYNNSHGRFGTSNDPSVANDGYMAYVFPQLVPDWTGLSGALDTLYYQSHPGAPPIPTGCAVQYTIPGARLRMSTGVSTGDVNLDGLKDVAFSNRADIYENMEFVSPGSTAGLPPIYDHLFFNKSTSSAMAFPTVELLGHANDFTAYGILAHVNLPDLGSNPSYIGQDTDKRLDWIDANFTRIDPDGDGIWANDVYFGHRLAPKNYPIVQAGTTIPFSLQLTTSRANGQGQWHLLASYAGPASPAQQWSGGPVPVNVPLQQDCLFSYATNAGKKAGTIPNSGLVDIQGSFDPPSCSHSGAIYFCVAIFKGTTARVTNVIRVPIQ
jgi:hypothetical protein